MKRILALLTVVGLVLAPSALAKGPHAILTSGPEAVEAGEPWDVTLELMETSGVDRPALVARRGDRVVAVRGRRVASEEPMTRYELRVVLPTEGRWRITVVDRKRRFAFPAVGVGSGTVPVDYVAFPKGSRAERQGGGGPWSAPETSVAAGEPLPPEVIEVATDAADGDSGGIPLWILPLIGVVLAGAGIMRVRSR